MEAVHDSHLPLEIEAALDELTLIGRDFSQFKVDDLAKAEARLIRVQRCTVKFESAIVELKPSVEHKIILDYEKAYNNLSDQIFELYYNLKALKEERITQSNSSQTQIVKGMSLSPIPLPKFLGNWESFYNIFESMVHNKIGLTSTEKFHYLLGCLSDNEEAKCVIAQFSICDENYRLAIAALKLRYESKRRTATALVQEMLDFPTSTKVNYAKLLSTFRNAVASLETLAIPNLGDFMVFHILYSKVDKSVRIDFDKKQSNLSEFPTASSLLEVIQKRMQMEELQQAVTSSHHVSHGHSTSISSMSKPKSDNKKSFVLNASANANTTYVKVCPMPNCKADHGMGQCPSFLSLSVDDRFNFVKKLNRCFQCLGAHARSKCTSTYSCRHCGAKAHNSALHRLNNSNGPAQAHASAAEPTPSTSSNSDQSGSLPAVNSLACNQACSVILSTAIVLVQGYSGNYIPLRAVVDAGSQRCFISEGGLQALGLKRKFDATVISGIGTHESVTKGKADLCIRSSLTGSNFELQISALVLPRICGMQPNGIVSTESKNKFSHLPLADPHWFKPASCDLLLSADVYSKILSDESPNIITGCPTAIKTHLGWLITGADSQQPRVSVLFTEGERLDDLVQRFFNQDVVQPQVVAADPEEEYVENFYKQTVSRNEDGRFVVGLPWRPGATPLVENKFNSLKSALYLENRLQKNSELKERYRKGLNDSLNSGHMVPASVPSRYILPQVLVEKPERSTTKLRVCLNASSPDSTGESVNSRLLPGAKLQKDICHIITRFRMHPIAVSADIKAMFTQIVVRESDRFAQHVLCKLSDSDEISEFEFRRLVFGFTSSPFLSQRVLLTLCDEEGSNCPLAVEAIRNSTYVDNIVSGAATPGEAIRLRQELTCMLSKGKFELRKWASNSSQVLEGLDPQHLESLDFSSPEPTAHLLGLNWVPMSDSFRFRVESFSGPSTKRSILSYCARIYDPMGFLVPFTHKLKASIQDCFRAGLDWDDPMPGALSSLWSQVTEQSHLLSQVSIGRHVPFSTSRSVEIVGFADASLVGYCAIMYALCRDEIGNISVHFLKAKSKVAPLKPSSINKLELSACVLLVQLHESLAPVLSQVTISRCTYFTDSKCALQWINIPAHRLKMYEANRVSVILEKSSRSDWRHCASAQNIADPGSRGLCPEEFLEISEIWFNGPSFLRDPPDDWPDLPRSSEDPEVIESLLVQKDPQADTSLAYVLSQKFSRLHSIKKAVAYWFRVFDYLKCKKATPMKSGPVSVSEFERAMLHLISVEQTKYYSQALHGKPDKSLSSLTPFVKDGILRVGGRLANASALSLSSRHPILIPGKSFLARMICQDIHDDTLHGGPLLMRAAIQNKYWITGIGSLLKTTVFKCPRCYRFKTKPIAPKMKDLPAARFETVRPFLRTGVDLCGPFKIRESARRKAPTHEKCYVVVFVCFATRAAHFEVLLELSTECFIDSFRRFVSRRSLPSYLHSDNGTNFQGSARQFKEVRDFFSKSSDILQRELVKSHVEWVFNPPAAPHYGGLWERLVGSLKYHLKRVMGTSVLTLVQFESLVISIEAILNSRPLMPLPNDPAENSCFLTPGHFLVGGPLNALPEYPLENVRHLDRWQIISNAIQSFWVGFKNHVIQTLMSRPKWQATSGPSLKVGDVVLLKGQSTSPLVWPLGRVIEVISTDDSGFSRIVKIKIGQSELVRAVHTLCPFQLSE